MKIAKMYFSPNVPEIDVRLIGRAVFPCHGNPPRNKIVVDETVNHVMAPEYLARSDNIGFPPAAEAKPECVTWQSFIDELNASCEHNS